MAKARLVQRTGGEHLGTETWTVYVRDGARTFVAKATFAAGRLVEAHDLDKRPVDPAALVAIQKAWG